MPVNPPPLQVSNASVVAGGSQILSTANLQVSAGEAVAVMGANGSGKSTLIRAGLGLMPLATGTATLFGVSLGQARTQVPWDRVGYVPQRILVDSPVPATAFEVAQTGLLGARRWRVRRSERHRVLTALDQVGVVDLASRPFGVLSGGQAQRVIIARALVRDPDLLILDEPLAGVDVLTQTSFASLLSDLHAQGRAIVMVLHELGPFAHLIDRAVVLSAGRTTHDGNLPRGHEHLHSDHANPPPSSTQRSLP